MKKSTFFIFGMICLCLICGCGEANTDSGKESVKNEKVKVSDQIILGAYEQTIATAGKEPIEWEVLDVDDGEALLISKLVLDVIPYNNEDGNVTWETCSLRKWMNSNFYDTAFSPDEKQIIVTSHNEAEDNEFYKTDGGKATDDNVFCLSLSEIRKYYTFEEWNDKWLEGSSKGLVNGASTYAKKKQYDDANAQGYLAVGDNGGASWWLRTPGQNNAFVSIVEFGFAGYNTWDNYAHSYCIGVRPAIRVSVDKLSSDNLGANASPADKSKTDEKAQAENKGNESEVPNNKSEDVANEQPVDNDDPSTWTDDMEIKINDPFVEKLIRAAAKVSEGPITYGSVKNIEEIYYLDDNDNTVVNDISSFRYLLNLKSLRVNATQIDDFGVLTKLPKLTHLIMYNADEKDLEELKNCCVESLKLDCYVGDDLNPLKGITSIKRVDYHDILKDEPVDISALGQLPNLKYLDIFTFENNLDRTGLNFTDSLVNVESFNFNLEGKMQEEHFVSLTGLKGLKNANKLEDLRISYSLPKYTLYYDYHVSTVEGKKNNIMELDSDLLNVHSDNVPLDEFLDML